MDISELVDEILDRVTSDPVSDDPNIDRRILHSDLWSLVDQYETDQGKADEVSQLQFEINTLQKENDELNDDLDSLREENQSLQERLLALEAEDD